MNFRLPDVRLFASVGAALLYIHSAIAGDAAKHANEIVCARINSTSLQHFKQPMPFDIPIYQWTDDVWQAFRDRAIECFNKGESYFGATKTTPRDVFNLINAYKDSTREYVSAAMRQQTELTQKKLELEDWKKNEPEREKQAASQRAEIERLTQLSKERAAKMAAERAKLAQLERDKAAALALENTEKQKLENKKSDLAAIASNEKLHLLEADVNKRLQAANQQVGPISCEQVQDRFALLIAYAGITKNPLMIAIMSGDSAGVCKITGELTNQESKLKEAGIRCKIPEMAIQMNQELRSVTKVAQESGC
jgi:hypothetical protein